MNVPRTGLTLAAAAAFAAATLSPASAAPVATAKPVPTPLQAASRTADTVRSALGLSGDEKLVPRSVVADADGTTHTRYDRTFKGLRVVGGDLIVARTKAGAVSNTIKNSSGKVAVASVKPKVALSSALSAGSAQRRGIASANHKADLVVFAAKGAPVLAYDVLTTGVRADQTPSRLHTIIDATTGAVLSSWDEIVHGTGNSQYSGEVPLNTTEEDGKFALKDSLGNLTTDLEGGESGEGTLFTDDDDVWGDGTPNDRQTAGVDAQYGAEKTFEYYKTTQDRNGIWDDGRGARSRVHYGKSYSNAFWDGQQMTYGDGEGDQKPLTQLDVAAHEMTHGVTENTAGLVYTGDAGGLNEASSDILAAGVEWFANNAKDVPDYLVGEEIDIRGDGTPLRYMDKPSKDGNSFDCYSDAVGGADPHFSSGPLNHWFFMAAEGSGAKTINGVEYDSPTCDGAEAVSGIGHEKAEKVWYRTLSTKLTSNATYQDARDGAIKSANELFGGGEECREVAKAFDAIAVPAGSATCEDGEPEPQS